MPDIATSKVPLTVGDGSTMQVYIAHPTNANRLPIVLVFQEAFGVNAHIRDVTERIATEGYYAIAPELYHRTAGKGFEVAYTDFGAVKKHMQELTTVGLIDDITTTYKFATKQNATHGTSVSAIGFCLGGRVSFLASAVLPLKSAACFYGGDLLGITGDRIKNITCPLLLCWGGKDQHIPKERRDIITRELDELNMDYVNVVFSQAGHGFNCDARQSYHAASAREAWELVKIFWKIHV